jgi:hypothetical protein
MAWLATACVSMRALPMQPFQDLSGWNIDSISAGTSTYAVSAHYMETDKSTITWWASDSAACLSVHCLGMHAGSSLSECFFVVMHKLESVAAQV